MKCKLCWAAVGVIVALYVADVVYPDWQNYDCVTKSINGVQGTLKSPEAMNKFKGRSFHAPKVDGCTFFPNNTVRELIE
jgi:hypothetical protein